MKRSERYQRLATREGQAVLLEAVSSQGAARVICTLDRGGELALSSGGAGRNTAVSTDRAGRRPLGRVRCREWLVPTSLR